MQLLARAAARAKAVTTYRNVGSVCVSTYSWGLRRFPRAALPFRSRVCRVRVRGLDHDLALRLGTSDGDVVEEIFGAGEYRGVIDSLPASPRTIVDLGANIGVSLSYWHQHFPAARLIAVEPDEANFRLCEFNAALGGYARRLTAFRACVAGTARQVTLERSGGAWGITLRERDEGIDDGTLVSAMTVPELLHQANVHGDIDLLKCDIEGAEREVFATAEAWLPRVAHLVIELHAPYLQDAFLADVARSGAHFEVKPLHLGRTLQVLHLMRKRA